MKHLQKLTALLLCGLLLLPTLAACTKTTADPNDPSQTSTENGETVEKTQILTNVFKGTTLDLPTDYSVRDDRTPYYNEVTGEIRICADKWVETEDGGSYEYFLLTFDADGNLISEQPFSLDGVAYINNGVLTEDRIYFLHSNYDETSATQTFHVAVYSFTDGTLTLSDDVTGLFAPSQRGWFYVNYIAVDADGLIYLGSEQEVVVLDASFIKQFTVSFPSWLNGLQTSPDGTVYVSDGQSFSPIDKTTKSLGQALTLPETFRAYNVHFGGGYDLYHNADDGLYGYNFPEDGEPAPEPVLLCNWANSDLIADNLEFAKIVSPDQMLVYERDPVTYDNSLMLYHRSADIDLAQTKVLEIAYVNADYNLSTEIVNFNKQNDGVRIIPRDYSIYNTSENYGGGEQKLVNDILLGLYKPDIITGNNTSDILRQVYDNSLYVDLYPFMETSATVKKDDLLGCVKRIGKTTDGGLWLIGSEVTVTTLLGTTSMLGDRTGWTLTEMIDFAKSLPQGTQLLYGISRESAPSTLLGQNGYAMFLDPETNTCHFETEEFIGYLDYLATLPETRDASANASASEVGISSEDYENQYLLYHNGAIALKQQYFWGVNDWVGLEGAFNTPDVTLIGYPTADGTTSGATVSMMSYVITSSCEYPTEAWSFLETILTPNEDDLRYGNHSLPTLKSSLRIACESEYESLFEVYFSGGMSWGTYREEDLNEPLREPGIRKFFTEDDANALIDWLDNDVGAPVAGSVDSEITEIINEEISSYLAGTKSAADCARIIQSRVTIWLAEHE